MASFVFGSDIFYFSKIRIFYKFNWRPDSFLPFFTFHLLYIIIDDDSRSAGYEPSKQWFH